MAANLTELQGKGVAIEACTDIPKARRSWLTLMLPTLERWLETDGLHMLNYIEPRPV
jgi:hypothetical protein